jgi:HK97 family phage prohead protease
MEPKSVEVLKRVFDGEIKDIDKGERTLTAYVSTSARDRMDEVLDPAGVDLTKFKKNPVVLFAHDYSSPPIGKALWIKKDGEGILSKVQFANTAFAEEIFGLYQGGFMKAFSVGFIPKDYTDGDGQKSPRRTYNKWELLEYSAVPVPANPEALMLAVSKGVISESTQKMFGVKKEEELPVPDPVIEPTSPETTVTDLASPELLAEIKILSDKNIALENEVLNLRYKLLEKEKKPLTLSEITDEQIQNIIKDQLVGVIRKTTGKVN